MMELVRAANGYAEGQAPWALAKAGETDRLGEVLRMMAEACRIIGHLLAPVAPTGGRPPPRAARGACRRTTTAAPAGPGLDALLAWGGGTGGVDDRRGGPDLPARRGGGRDLSRTADAGAAARPGRLARPSPARAVRRRPRRRHRAGGRRRASSGSSCPGGTSLVRSGARAGRTASRTSSTPPSGSIRTTRRRWTRRAGRSSSSWSRERTRAVGEIGLDFFRNLSPPGVPARGIRAPAGTRRRAWPAGVVHDRDAHAEVTEALLAWGAGGEGRRGVLHAFSGDDGDGPVARRGRLPGQLRAAGCVPERSRPARRRRRLWLPERSWSRPTARTSGRIERRATSRRPPSASSPSLRGCAARRRKRSWPGVERRLRRADRPHLIERSVGWHTSCIDQPSVATATRT